MRDALLPTRRPIASVRLQHDRARTLYRLEGALESLAPFENEDVVWAERSGDRRASTGSSIAIVRLLAATLRDTTEAVRSLPAVDPPRPRDLGVDPVPMLVAMRAAAPDADEVDAPGPYTKPTFDGHEPDETHPSLRPVVVPLALRLPALLLVQTDTSVGGGAKGIRIDHMGSMRGDPETDPDDPVEAMRALRAVLDLDPLPCFAAAQETRP